MNKSVIERGSVNVCVFMRVCERGQCLSMGLLNRKRKMSLSEKKLQLSNIWKVFSNN